jgi:polyhydroxyalkanoate synthesis regulator phasin
MFEKISKKKLTGIILTVILVVSLATTAFAADQTDGTQQVPTERKPSGMDFSKMSETIKSAIDSLVTKGTITQEQADAAVKAYNPGERKGDSKEGNISGDILIIKKEQLDGLVTAGTITQAQADAIQEISESNSGGALRGGKGPGHNNRIDELVTAGTITQAQADAFNEAVKTGRESQKSVEDVLKELVAAGTVTQAQADAISKIYAPGEGKGNPPEARKNSLEELVTAGTITQSQADAISEAVKAALDSMKKQ